MHISLIQVLQSLPRVMRDTDILQQEALMLREKMKTVREEMSKVQSDTGESLATLEHIDQLKTRLQKAKQALHEADNWSLLAADLEEVPFAFYEFTITKLSYLNNLNLFLYDINLSGV